MKNKFYNFINFLSSELHFFEYLFYSFLVWLSFYLFEYYNFPITFFERIISCVVALAFMNTWEIKARKHKKDVEDNE